MGLPSCIMFSARVFHSPKQLLLPSQLLTLFSSHYLGQSSRYLGQSSHYFVPFYCTLNPYYPRLIMDGQIPAPILKLVERHLTAEPMTFSHTYTRSDSYITSSQPSFFTNYTLFLGGKWHENAIRVSSHNTTFDSHCLLFPLTKKEAESVITWE